MQSILKELFNGNISFDRKFYSQDSSFVKAAKKRSEAESNLKKTLNDKDIKLFDEYCEAQADVDFMKLYSTYEDTVRFMMLFMIEIFGDDITGYD